MSPFFIQSALFFKVVSCGFCDVAKVEYGLLLNAPRHVDDETTLRDACIVECFSTVTRSIDLRTAAVAQLRIWQDAQRRIAHPRSAHSSGRGGTTNLARMATNRTPRAQAEYVVIASAMRVGQLRSSTRDQEPPRQLRSMSVKLRNLPPRRARVDRQIPATACQSADVPHVSSSGSSHSCSHSSGSKNR